ncbi:hypothetical protein [Paracidovorax anthurii]|uniref:Uncharacterized protein n=1 Tax=Paracidovorax anthurii TaxID=78229 RepID=A0A328ZA31_9BURK|nr:hypothetical protein [Paracidovorax anthurii]RAR79166.1 hypothetical protein AX018_102758 [Paracidovorax anthurii]
MLSVASASSAWVGLTGMDRQFTRPSPDRPRALPGGDVDGLASKRIGVIRRTGVKQVDNTRQTTISSHAGSKSLLKQLS